MTLSTTRSALPMGTPTIHEGRAYRMEPPPGGAREELRQLLIDAGLSILDDPDTPLELRKVAELAGKSRTAPYLVFGKESEGGGVLGLRMAVAAEGARMMAERLGEAERSSADPLVAFQRVARAFLGFVTEHPRLFRLMFGPEIGVSGALPARELADHREFQNLSRERLASERIIQRVIARCQALRIAPPGDTTRYTMIAWASMVGAAFLLLDEVLEAAGVRTEVDDAANLVTESVLGLDPQPLGEVTHTFLQAQAKSEPAPPAPVAYMSADDTELSERPAAGEPPAASDVERAPRPAGAPAHDEAPGRPLGRERARAAGAGSLEAVRRLLRRARLAEGDEELRAGPAGPAEGIERMALDRPRAEGTPGEAMSLYPGLRRAAHSRKALYGARILWIDDHPENLRAEIETLRAFRAEVATARSTEQAEARLGAGVFDVIVSDIERGGDAEAGVAALPRLRRRAPDTPVVFYVARLDRERAPPEGALGVTNRTDELLHLILDALERRA